MTEVPDAGDLVWINFNPHAGHEQAGHRPALVLSPRSYHERTAFAVVCPITSNVMPYPFKVVLPDGLPIGGAVLADQVKSIDRRARQLKVAGSTPRTVLVEVQARTRGAARPPGRVTDERAEARCRGSGRWLSLISILAEPASSSRPC